MSTCAPPADGAALAAPLCPLCGQPNQCAASASGRLDAPCWCRDVVIAAETLARIPAASRNQVCLCPRCAGVGDHPPNR